MARVAMFVMLLLSVIGQNFLMGIRIGRKKVDVIHKGKTLQDLVILDSRVAPHDLDNLNAFVKPKLLEDSRDEGMMLQENGIEDFHPLDVSLETDEGPYEGQKHLKEMDQISVSDGGNNDEGYNLRDMPEYNLETKADYKGNQEAIDWLMKDPNDFNVKSFEDSNALEDTDNFDSNRDSTDIEDHQRIKGSERHQDKLGKVTLKLKHVSNSKSIQDYDKREDETQLSKSEIESESSRHPAKTKEWTDKYNDFQDSEYPENDNVDQGQKSWNSNTNGVNDGATDRSFDEYDDDDEVSSRKGLQKRIENQDTKLYQELENYAKIDNYDYSDYLDNYDFHGNDFKNAGSKYEDMTDTDKGLTSDDEDDFSWSNDENSDRDQKEDSRERYYEWNRDDSTHADDEPNTEKLEDTNDAENSDASGSLPGNKHSIHGKMEDETDDKSKENSRINSDQQAKNKNNSHKNDDSKLQELKGGGTHSNGNYPVIQKTHSLASDANHVGKSQEEKNEDMGQPIQAVTYNENDMLSNNNLSHQTTIISKYNNRNHTQAYNSANDKITTSAFLKPGSLWIPGQSEIKGIQHSNLDEHVVSLSVPKNIEETKNGAENEKTNEETPSPTEKPKTKASDKQLLILQKVEDLLNEMGKSPDAQINAALKTPKLKEKINFPHHNIRAHTHRKSHAPTSTGFRRNHPSYLSSPPRSYSLEDLTKMEQIISFLRGTTTSRSVPTRPSTPLNISLKSLYYYPIHPTPEHQNDGTSDAKDATFSEWNDWSRCSVTCGKGTSVRARVCLVDTCAQKDLFQTRNCHEGVCADEVERESLEEHNKLRAKHLSPPLSWSSSLARKAQKIAQSLAGKDFLTLDDLQERQGESIAQIVYTGASTARKAIEKWYKEIESYSFSYPKINSETRHFAQIAWKGTKKMGLAVTRSSSGEYAFVVALYDPPVLSENHLRQNILPPGHKHDLYSTFRRRKSLG